MAQPNGIPQGPAEGAGFEQWIRKGQDFPNLQEQLKSSPTTDPVEDEEMTKEKQQSK